METQAERSQLLYSSQQPTTITWCAPGAAWCPLVAALRGRKRTHFQVMGGAGGGSVKVTDVFKVIHKSLAVVTSLQTPPGLRPTRVSARKLISRDSWSFIVSTSSWF